LKYNDDLISADSIPTLGKKEVIPLLSKYTQKVYYSLDRDSIIKISNAMDWDIALNCNDNGPKLIFNYAFGNKVFAINTQDTNFNTSYDLTYIAQNIDKIDYANFYSPTATLFNSMLNSLNQSNNFVYIAKFDVRGYKKIQIKNLTPNSIEIKYSNIDQSNIQSVTITKDPTKNFVYFSLFDNQYKDIEPDNKSTWDLEFTRYNDLVTEFDSTIWYGVTGVLNNPSKKIETVVLKNKSLDKINFIDSVSGLTYTSATTGIGYSWKKYSSKTNEGFYTILPDSYVVRVDGKYSALQFIDFTSIVNGAVELGYPTFYIKKLK
jgi:hypothetical protein